jgi:hypothetical protein
MAVQTEVAYPVVSGMLYLFIYQEPTLFMYRFRRVSKLITA